MQASGLNRTAVSWVIVVVPGGEAPQSSAHHLSTFATGRRRKPVFEVTPPIRPPLSQMVSHTEKSKDCFERKSEIPSQYCSLFIDLCNQYLMV